MKHAADALDAVMHASFHHEMLAMLYFPDEHKWAVYTPLFGPIGKSSRAASMERAKVFPLSRLLTQTSKSHSCERYPQSCTIAGGSAERDQRMAQKAA